MLRSFTTNIGIILYTLKDYEGSQIYLKKACELRPLDADLMYNYASALYSGFKWREAAEIFTKYLELRPEDNEAAGKAADAYYQSGEYDQAAAYERLVAENREDG